MSEPLDDDRLGEVRRWANGDLSAYKGSDMYNRGETVIALLDEVQRLRKENASLQQDLALCEGELVRQNSVGGG